jgi:CBS domain-containing protein
MTLQDILNVKGDVVYKIGPNAMLDEVARALVDYKVGALLICDDPMAEFPTPLGIVTERDILYHCARSEKPLCDVMVAEVMSTQLVTASLSDAVEDCMGVMTSKRIRHVPVMSGGRLAGMISIGDLVKAQYDHLILENSFMKNYIHG